MSIEHDSFRDRMGWNGRSKSLNVRALAAVLCVASLASAQTGRTRTPRSAAGKAGVDARSPDAATTEPKSAVAPAATESRREASSASPESTIERREADDPLLTPPPAAQRAEGPKLSPLTPDRAEFAAGPPPPAPADFDRLMSHMTALRSRIQALTATLFKSKLRISLEARADSARIERLRVTLDEGVVFAAPERFAGGDERVVYEHAVAPGQHVLGIEVERYDGASKQYRTWQTSQFAILVPEGQLLDAELVIEDDSDMAEEFPEDRSGEYDLRVRLRARASEPR